MKTINIDAAIGSEVERVANQLGEKLIGLMLEGGGPMEKTARDLLLGSLIHSMPGIVMKAKRQYRWRREDRMAGVSP